MRLIDADALIDELGISDEDIVFKEILEDAPTIDAIPVVRCKDCVSFHYSGMGEITESPIAQRESRCNQQTFVLTEKGKTMIDYIRREDAITLICSTESEVAKNAPFDAEWFSRIAKRQHEIIDIIRDMPSADVTPVRHGHWIKISPAGIHECSECGKNVMTSDIEAYEYCHGCGARMDDDKWEE